MYTKGTKHWEDAYIDVATATVPSATGFMLKATQGLAVIGLGSNQLQMEPIRSVIANGQQSARTPRATHFVQAKTQTNTAFSQHSVLRTLAF